MVSGVNPRPPVHKHTHTLKHTHAHTLFFILLPLSVPTHPIPPF